MQLNPNWYLMTDAWDNPLWCLRVESCQKVNGEWKLRFVTFKMYFWPGRSKTAFFCADLQAKWIPGLTSELGGFLKERNLSVRVMHMHTFQALQDWSCSHLNLEEKGIPTRHQIRKGHFRILLPYCWSAIDMLNNKYTGKDEVQKEKYRCSWRISRTEMCGSCLLSGSPMAMGTYILHCPQPKTRSLCSWLVSKWLTLFLHLCENIGIAFCSPQVVFQHEHLL